VEPQPPSGPTMYLGMDGTGVPVRKDELAGIAGKQPDGSAKAREVKLLNSIDSRYERPGVARSRRAHPGIGYAASFISSGIPDYRDPEDRHEIASRRRHEPNRDQWAGDRVHGIQRLAQSEGRAAKTRRADIGDQGIPGRSPNALTHPVDEPGAGDPANRGRQRKDRFRACRQAVSQSGGIFFCRTSRSGRPRTSW